MQSVWRLKRSFDRNNTRIRSLVVSFTLYNQEKYGGVK